MGIQYVWNCLDDLSFMLINTMISMPVPGIVQMIQAVLLNFIYLDILLTDQWIPLIFDTSSSQIEQSGGLNSFFEENGFSSKFLISNLGSSFVYLTLYCVLLILYLLLSLFSRYASKIDWLGSKLKRKLSWNLTLSLFFS